MVHVCTCVRMIMCNNDNKCIFLDISGVECSAFTVRNSRVTSSVKSHLCQKQKQKASTPLQSRVCLLFLKSFDISLHYIYMKDSLWTWFMKISPVPADNLHFIIQFLLKLHTSDVITVIYAPPVVFLRLNIVINTQIKIDLYC